MAFNMLYRWLDRTDVGVNIYFLAGLFFIPCISLISYMSLAQEIGGQVRSSHIEGMQISSKNLSRWGVYDAADPHYRRFIVEESDIKKESVITHREDRYIPFPMLEIDSGVLEKIWASSPTYVIRPKQTRENKQARLLLHLYHQRRYITFLRAYKYFIGKYVNSKYEELVENLAAEVYYKLFQKEGQEHYLDRMKFIYTRLGEKYPKSKLKRRNNLILAYVSLKLRRGREAVQNFIKILDKAKKDKNKDYDFVMWSLAEGYLLLNQPEEALGIYRKLKKGSGLIGEVEASYRIGDIYFYKRSLDKAVRTYQSALGKYPEFSSRFPNAHYNMAESLFWLGKYGESLKSYVDFIKNFPSHRHGGYALTRIGELLGILGVDSTRVEGALMESHFRFGSHPGAQVARMRILSQRMKGMKPQKLNQTLSEMREIARHSSLPDMLKFMTLMVADGFYRRGEYDRALTYLMGFFRQNYGNLDLFQKRIVENIIRKIETLLGSGQAYEALREYDKYSITWLKKVDSVNLKYLLARAFEEVGLMDEAISGYEWVLSRLESGRTSRSLEEKARPFLTRGHVQLRLAEVYVQRGKFEKALSLLGRERILQSDKDKVDRVRLLAMIYERKGLYHEAKQYLSEVLEDLPLSLQVFLLRMQLKTGELASAMENLVKIEKRSQGGVAMKASLKREFLEVKAQLLLKMDRKMAAFETYMSLLEEFDNQPMNLIRYKAGKILLERWDLKRAQKVWRGFQGGQRQLYRELARESLRHEKWIRNHKKQIRQIQMVTQLQ